MANRLTDSTDFTIDSTDYYYSSQHLGFWTTVANNGSPYATWPLSCLSLCNVSVVWPNGWMDQDVTWYGGRIRRRWHCVRWGSSSILHTQRGTAASVATFPPMYIVANRSPTAANWLPHLSVFCLFSPLSTVINMLNFLPTTNIAFSTGS